MVGELNDDNITCYEKTIDINEINNFFEVKFIAEINNKQFIIISIKDDIIEVVCDDYKYAKEHDFKEIEHGVWIKNVSCSSFDKFLLIKIIQDKFGNITEEIKELDKDKLIKNWNFYDV